MFEELLSEKYRRYELAVSTAQAHVLLAPSPRPEEEYHQSVDFAANYFLLAIKLHLGAPLSDTEFWHLEFLDEEDKFVLEDPYLRARVVGAGCTALSGILQGLSARKDERVSSEFLLSLKARQKVLCELRLDAALTISGGDIEQAKHLVQEFMHTPLPSVALLPEKVEI